MTRFEYFTQNARRLAELIELAVDDALTAEGCSMELILPPGETGSWEAWLEHDSLYEDSIGEEFRALQYEIEEAARRKDEKKRR